MSPPPISITDCLNSASSWATNQIFSKTMLNCITDIYHALIESIADTYRISCIKRCKATCQFSCAPFRIRAINFLVLPY